MDPLNHLLLQVFLINQWHFKMALNKVLQCQKGFHEPPVRNAEWNGRSAYATGDGLVAHPFKKGYYKVIGRNKDQILLSSGQVVSFSINYFIDHQ